MKQIILISLLFVSFLAIAQERNPLNKAIFLEDINWISAKEVLTPDAVVVIPLGAGAKEHGPHLPLSSDFIQAEGCKNLLALERKVIIAPTLNYGFYPAFIKYAGSTTLSYSTSVDMVLQVVRGLSTFGPKRFYIINIGISTTPTLEAASKILAQEGILLYFSNYFRQNYVKNETMLRTETYPGHHADEIETSNVLAYREDLVDMKKAVNDSSVSNKKGILTPVAIDGGILNTTGVNGYATLGTKEKGKLSVKLFLNEVIREIDSITNCPLPVSVDRYNENQKYAGTYTDKAGNTLTIMQKANHLSFVWKGRDLSNLINLYRDSEDFYSSLFMNILFVKNEQGEVVKAWCQSQGESFWVTKSK